MSELETSAFNQDFCFFPHIQTFSETGSTEGAGQRVFPWMEKAIAFGSLHSIASRTARDGGDPLETRMTKGRSGIRRFQRLFGYFLVAQKVTRRRNRGHH